MNPCAQCPWEQGTLWSMRVSVNQIMELYKLFLKKCQKKKSLNVRVFNYFVQLICVKELFFRKCYV